MPGLKLIDGRPRPDTSLYSLRLTVKDIPFYPF